MTMSVAASVLGAEVELFLDSANPERAAIARDPYPFYARLRAHAPVYQAPGGRWVITGHEECAQFLQDSRTTHTLQVPTEKQGLAHRIFMGSMLFRDPPEHTRLRRTVSRLFTPKAVAGLRESVAHAAAELFEPLRDVAEFDIRSGPAFRLPVIVIARVLGVPVEDFDNFQSWGKTLLFMNEQEPVGPGYEQANREAADALAYFTDIIAQRRRNPGNDLISGLVAAEDGLTDEEIVAMCVILHVGGHSTTTDLLTNGVYQLAVHPDAWTVLRDDPSHIPTAVEEILRFDASVAVTVERKTREDIEIGGVTIPGGSTVHAAVAAGNRDPRVFVDPEQFDVTRTQSRHLSFATGNHACIGAHLARIEAQEFLRVLTCEFPELRIAVPTDQLEWQPTYVHRGLTKLPVSWAS